MGQPGTAGPGLTLGWHRGDRIPAVHLGAEGVVPLAVEAVARERECAHPSVTNTAPGLKGTGVELGTDGESGAGHRRGDAVDDDLVAVQRSTAPVHGDVAEQAVLDGVPFRCAGREMAHGDLQTRFHGQRGQFELPGTGAIAVGAARVGGDEQAPGLRVGGAANRGHQRRIEATAKAAVSWSVPTLTQPVLALRS